MINHGKSLLIIIHNVLWYQESDGARHMSADSDRSRRVVSETVLKHPAFCSIRETKDLIRSKVHIGETDWSTNQSISPMYQR